MAVKKNDTSKLALLVHLENSYGQLKMIASVVEVQPDGELHNRQWSFGSGTGRQYEGFRVTTYVDYNGMGGSPDEARGIWGSGYYFEPSRIDSAEHATAIATVMRKLESGLEKLTSAEGYIRDDDFGLYLMRIARILGIAKVYVRNRKRTQTMTGEKYRSVDGAGLQSYVSMVVSDVHAGRRSEYV